MAAKRDDSGFRRNDGVGFDFENQVKPDVSAKGILLPKISPEGVEIVIVFALATLVLGLLSDLLGTVGIALTIFAFYFFRDPERYTPEGDELAVAPADGIVLPLKKAQLPKEIADGDTSDYIKISIFMSVFNVHVNRNPMSGTVLKKAYVAGKFVDVRADKDSEDNERALVLLDTKYGKIGYVQIAGLVARRIVNKLSANDVVKGGERFGLIRFGSRLDIYLPADKFDIRVKAGQKMVAGETVLAVAR